jgi:hypothetical protein
MQDNDNRTTYHHLLPRIYRDKNYIGEAILYILQSIFLYFLMYNFDYYSFLLFIPITLVLCSLTLSQKITLYYDHIELSNVFGSRSVFRKEIERLDTITVGKESNKTTWHYLIARAPDKFLMPISSDIKIDSLWLKWFADIPENKIDKSECLKPTTEAYATILVFILCIPLFLLAMIIIPIAQPLILDALSLLIMVAMPFSTTLLLRMVIKTRHKELRQGDSLKFCVGYIGACLAAALIFIDCIGVGTFAIQEDAWVFDSITIVFISLFVQAIFHKRHRALILNRPALLTVLLFVAAYGYLSPLFINRLLDPSLPQFARPSIERKFYQTGKSSGWYLTLAPWGPETRERNYETGRYIYERLTIKDRICAQLHQGALGVRWYKLSETCPGTLASVKPGTEALTAETVNHQQSTYAPVQPQPAPLQVSPEITDIKTQAQTAQRMGGEAQQRAFEARTRALAAQRQAQGHKDFESGYCVMTWPQGQRYEGAFRDRKMSGYGVMTWPAGARYEGERQKDNMNGYGIFTWPDGGHYEGEFRDGQRAGHGVMTLANGDRWEGEFSNDKENGLGVYTWSTGDRYEGEAGANGRSGRGVQTGAGGVIQAGTGVTINSSNPLSPATDKLSTALSVIMAISLPWTEPIAGNIPLN